MLDHYLATISLSIGGTLTMAPNPSKGGLLVPVEGAVNIYRKEIKELLGETMPEVVIYKYSSYLGSSDKRNADLRN